MGTMNLGTATLHVAGNETSLVINDVIIAIPMKSALELLGGSNGATFTPERKTRKSKSKSPSKSKHRPRRSPKDLEKTMTKVVGLLKARKKTGMNMQALEKTTKLARAELVGPLKLAMKKKLVKSKGQKRATVYFVR